MCGVIMYTVNRCATVTRLMVKWRARVQYSMLAGNISVWYDAVRPRLYSQVGQLGYLGINWGGGYSL